VGIRIFVGLEGNIKADGTFLFTDDRVEVLIAAIHTALNQEKEKILDRYEKPLRKLNRTLWRIPQAEYLADVVV